MFIKGWALTGFLSCCGEVFCSACAFTYRAMTNVVYFHSRESCFYDNSIYFKHLIPVVKISTIWIMWINTFVIIYNTMWKINLLSVFYFWVFYFPLLCEKLKTAKLNWACVSHRFKMKGFSCLTHYCLCKCLNIRCLMHIDKSTSFWIIHTPKRHELQKIL